MKLIFKKDARYCLHFLQKTISDKARLIGSFGSGDYLSFHDIDILLPTTKKTAKLKSNLCYLLDTDDVEETDLESWYFHNTIFGDIDIFFSIKDL